MHRIGGWLTFVACLLSLWLPSPVSHAGTTMESAVEQLKSKDFNTLSQAVDQLAEAGGDQASKILNALLERRLYVIKQGRTVVYVEKHGREYQVTDVLTDESLGTLKKSTLQKVPLNNQLRSQIRTVLATMDLQNPDADIRLGAVNQLLDRPEPGYAGII